MIEIIKYNLWTLPCGIVILLLGTILMIKTKFYPVLYFPKILYNTIGKIGKQDKSFRMMCTSLGGTIGVGNAIGVAGAIVEGGPGAVFWMGVASVLSMVIKYAEVYLSLLYKGNNNLKGPLNYISAGAGVNFFAVLYSFLCILVSLGMGNLSQFNAALKNSSDIINIPCFYISIILAIFFSLIALGGIRKISGFSQITVPALSLIYIILLSVILFRQRENIPNALSQIISTSGVYEGIKWSLIKRGISGGFSKSVFSSEAGLGSAGFTHAESDESPTTQGMWAITEVFIDALICIMTALAILTAKHLPFFEDVSLITKGIFEIHFGVWGKILYSVSITLFALSSALCWYYIGVCAIEFLTNNNKIKNLYSLTFFILIILSSFISSSTIIDLSDIANALMMILNTSVIFIMIKKIKFD